MRWGEVALGVVTLGMLGSIGYTIILARSIERGREYAPDTAHTGSPATAFHVR